MDVCCLRNTTNGWACKSVWSKSLPQCPRGLMSRFSVCSSKHSFQCFVSKVSILNFLSLTSHTVSCVNFINVARSLACFSLGTAAEMGQTTFTLLKGNTVIAAKPFWDMNRVFLLHICLEVKSQLQQHMTTACCVLYKTNVSGTNRDICGRTMGIWD